MRITFKTFAFAIIVFIISITLTDSTLAVNISEKTEVNSEGTLKHCLLNKFDDNAEVVLTRDIHINDTLAIESNLTLDLNGHSLIFTGPTVQILVGKKTLVGQIPYQIYHEGHFERGSKRKYHQQHGNVPADNYYETEYYDVWIPGYYVTEYKDQYEYDSNVRVNIKNGVIKGADGFIVTDKKSAYWLSEARGEHGFSPFALFHVISGGLKVENIKIIAGNGSDGGGATHSALWHVPFIGGGDGGNGGKGGNGGSVFFAEQGVVSVDSKSRLIPGKGGKGGNGSKANPNYWLWPGNDGQKGKDGNMGEVVNNNSKLLKI
jgi:hypothetical protein